MKNNSNFYNAIRLYADKHSTSLSSNYQLTGLGILSKVLPAVRYIKEYLLRILPLLVDFLLILFTFFSIQFGWSYYRYEEPFYFGTFRYLGHYICYAILWIVTLIFQGTYFSNEKIVLIFKGAVLGGVINMVLYSLLPDSWRFSRGILLLTSIIVPLLISAKYWLIRYMNRLDELFVSALGEENYNSKIYNFKNLKKSSIESAIESGQSMKYILDYNIIGVENIIKLMCAAGRDSKFEFYNNKQDIVFYSDSQNKRGESLNLENFMNLSQKKFLLNKRTLDLFVAILVIPIIVLAQLMRLKFNFDKLLLLLKGGCTIVGYSEELMNKNKLPLIAKSLIMCYDPHESVAIKTKKSIDYAFNYSIFDDVFIISSRMRSFIKALIE